MGSNLWIFISFGLVLLVKGVPTGIEEGNMTENSEGEFGDLTPPVIKGKNETFLVKPGEKLELKCPVENPNSGVILWYFNNEAIYTGIVKLSTIVENDNLSLDEKTNSLIIASTKKSGLFQCEVIFNDNKQHLYFNVILEEPAKVVKINQGDHKIVLNKGSPLSLECQTEGEPKPEVVWIKKTRHTEDNIAKGSTLKIDSVTKKNSGTYTCLATNSLGNDSKKIDVFVEYEPEIEDFKHENEQEVNILHSGIGLKAELICTVHAEPKAEVHWYKDTKQLETNSVNHSFINKGNKHHIIISSVSKEDFGEYKCHAKNSKGVVSKTIKFLGSPSKPKFIKAQPSEDHKSIELIWNVESLSEIVDSELLYKEQDKSDKLVLNPKAINAEKTNYIVKQTLEGLKPATYQTQLRVKNTFGWSELSDFQTFVAGHHYHQNLPKDEPTQTGLLESGESGASELRISFALLLSLLIARYFS